MRHRKSPYKTTNLVNADTGKTLLSRMDIPTLPPQIFVLVLALEET